jgi:hypothetical protein
VFERVKLSHPFSLPPSLFPSLPLSLFPSLPASLQTTAERIQKMAAYVHRNGPDFERMMTTKERGNDKFSFLFEGGENRMYYR